MFVLELGALARAAPPASPADEDGGDAEALHPRVRQRGREVPAEVDPAEDQRGEREQRDGQRPPPIREQLIEDCLLRVVLDGVWVLDLLGGVKSSVSG